MSKKSEFNYAKYWETNIKSFGNFYGFNPDEDIIAPPGIKFFYRKFVFPMEKDHINRRYSIVCDMLNGELGEGIKLADIGCGTGVFTKFAVQHGADVIAIDFTETALKLTDEALNDSERDKVSYMLLDAEKQTIPVVDVAIAIGVIAYVKDFSTFAANVGCNCNCIIFNFLDEKHIINRMRKILRFLDVRHYIYNNRREIEALLRKEGFQSFEWKKLTSGYVLKSKK